MWELVLVAGCWLRMTEEKCRCRGKLRLCAFTFESVVIFESELFRLDFSKGLGLDWKKIIIFRQRQLITFELRAVERSGVQGW
jgi:hypothetical protein